MRPLAGLLLLCAAAASQDEFARVTNVQMPPGIPVATVAIGRAGAKNAAHLAAQMLALGDSELAVRIVRERADNAQAVLDKDRALQRTLSTAK